jgi:hypothetical protein
LERLKEITEYEVGYRIVNITNAVEVLNIFLSWAEVC